MSERKTQNLKVRLVEWLYTHELAKFTEALLFAGKLHYARVLGRSVFFFVKWFLQLNTVHLDGQEHTEEGGEGHDGSIGR